MLRDLPLQEIDTASELLHAIDAVFDADPAVEAFALQFGEDGIVVVEALADLAVTEAFGIALSAAFFFAEIFEGAFGEVTVAGMHRHHAMRDALQQLQRVLAREVGVGGIVVHTEVRMIHGIDEFAEDIHLLCELGILPEIVLVVIFDDERDAALLCVWQARINRVRRELHAFVDAEFGSSLAAEHAAVAATERVRHVDPAFLLRDLFFTERGIGMGEVGRAAHHRDDFASVLDLLAKARPVFFISHLQEACIPLQALYLERGGKFDPFGHGHGSFFAKGDHEGFGEGSELGHRGEELGTRSNGTIRYKNLPLARSIRCQCHDKV